MPLSSFVVEASAEPEPSIEYRKYVSQFGITWTFREPMLTGRFAAGDWWVVGPVEVIDITPETIEIQQTIPFATSWYTPPEGGSQRPNISYANHTVSMHGSMLNPHPRPFLGTAQDTLPRAQGFDSRLARMRGGYATSGQILPGDFEPSETQYHEELNVARNLPLTLQPGDSLISSESFEEPASAVTNIAFNPHNNTQIKTMAILTVLDSPAPEGSFRPPYIRPYSFGTAGNEASDWERLTSVTWTVDDLDFSRLARVALPEGVNFASPRMQTTCWFHQNNNPISRCATQSCYACSGYENNPQDWMKWITRLVERPRIHIQTTWLGRNWHPHYNFLPLCGGAIRNNGAYGRDMANLIGAALLTLQLDVYTDDEKRELLIHMVQYGIDIYGIVSAGGAWHNDGGHNMGRKMPMLLAGAVLNDDSIIEFGDAKEHFVFHEDQQTFFVQQSDIDDMILVQRRDANQAPIAGDYVYQPRVWENDHPETHAAPRAPSRPELHIFTQDMLGRPAWGQQHHDPIHNRGRFRSGSNWSASYRELNSSSMMAHVLTARLMGLEEAWNWPALFEYIDLAAEHDRVAHFPLPTSPTNEPNFHTGVISMIPFTARMWNAHRWRTEIAEIAVNGNEATIEYNISNLIPNIGSVPRANLVVAIFDNELLLGASIVPVASTGVPDCDCAHDLNRENWLNPICIDHPPIAAVGRIDNIEIPQGATGIRVMIWDSNIATMKPLTFVVEYP